MPPILDVRDLHVHFHTLDGVVNAVNGVSFTLEEGETLAIVGESGSGKSVTVMSLLGLIPVPPGKVTGGSALYYGANGERDLLKMSELELKYLRGEAVKPDEEFTEMDLLQMSREELRNIRGGQIGFVFQDPISSLNPILPIGEQVSEILTRHKGLPKEEALERAIRLLGHVGIPDPELRVKNYPFEFSGGMRQRVVIAIAIACTPKIVIADEPTTALDVTVQAQIVDLFKQLRQDLDVSIIWITHDLGVVAGIADRVLVMYGGRPVEVALVDDLYDNPRHPYTTGLLCALPRLDSVASDRLECIPGAPPDMLQPLVHCPFAWRCDYAFERCWEKIPPLISVGEKHKVACFYDLEKAGPRDV
ncbi:MAG: ABC transporter ATP-binding protein [Anaerolineales bacterium]|uniref:ABC transporter ATP-binding protein n=1 Tax=Candidatus Desulfolinea nitratireducens TaxID=2841698 RepID=A0A8J6THJ0_9CHLR|nr:ABC transporter ATP-binding protein [Candidatus Desulfolinea nitratireducens]MBL6983439.1 ABC transporter ATP-binding protein [Anaerolineales bacterium]